MEYYQRKIEEKLEKWLNRKEIILIKGPRQCGKKTLLLHLREKLGGNYVSLEDETILKTFDENPKEFAKRYFNGQKTFLFIDEAQYSKNAGKNLKLLFDLFSENLKLIVTGSGSFDIKVEIGKHLVGRAIYFEMFPLDFEEFLMWKARDLHKIFVDYKNAVMDFILQGKSISLTPSFEKEFRSLLSEYLIYGGFPAIVKEKDESIKKELLKNLTRTYLEKDIFFFLNIRHIEKFRSLLSYLSFNVGSIIEISSIMNELKMDYRTVESYISILENTYVISLVSPFYKNLATELKKAKKAYFIDVGLRNSIMNNFMPLENRTDKGVILENFIFNELRLNFDEKINYWRTTSKAEVDFVIQVGNEIIPIEVKNQAKLKGGFFSFLKAYKPKRALVFTEKEFSVNKFNNTEVAFVPHYFI
jgi:predicted AAA+ superfamily ATPase